MPVCEMGLGICRLLDIHLLFSIKSCWKLLLKVSLWSKYCPIKYKVEQNGWFTTTPSFSSMRWKKLVGLMPWVISHSLWLLTKVIDLSRWTNGGLGEFFLAK